MRDLLITPALGQLAPIHAEVDGVTMGTGVAVAVLAGWALLPTLAGAWRTRVRDA